MPEREASLFEKPFESVRTTIVPERSKTKYAPPEKYPFWQLWNPRPAMRAALADVERFIVTSRVSKHRVFAFTDNASLPDGRLAAIADGGHYMFGVLHSRAHQAWSHKYSSRHGDGDDGGRPTYNVTTCFETFPFPEPDKKQREAIAAAAKELDAFRTAWLDPPEWTRTEVLEFPGSVDGPWKRYVHDPNARGIGTVRHPRLVPQDEECAQRLKARTLTNLYNERPTWLDLAHRRLDEAVFAAYGWNPDLTDDQLLAALLALNLERAAAESKTDGKFRRKTK